MRGITGTDNKSAPTWEQVVRDNFEKQFNPALGLTYPV